MPPSRQSLARLPLPPNVYLILLSLSHGELHGYQLRKDVAARSDGAVRLDPGSLYRLIGRLLDDGLIAELTSAGPDDRRRYYRLTAQGGRVLQSETDRLANLVEQARGRRRARQLSR
jgi:DNA-binding PadR family transcriptional regulator